MLGEHLRLFQRLRNGTKIPDAKCEVLPRAVSGRRQLRKFLRKSSRWNLFPESDSQERKTSAATNNFSLWKKNGPKEPEVFYVTFDCYHLKRARTRSASNIICATRPRPRPDPRGSGRYLRARQPGPGRCRPTAGMTCSIWIRSLPSLPFTFR
jgi:hypothetical protein